MFAKGFETVIETHDRFEYRALFGKPLDRCAKEGKR